MDYTNLIEPDDVSDLPYIFVSYSRQDMPSVQSILKILKENHFRFWYDKGLKSGVEWAEEIGDKIDRCDQFFVFISSNSVKSKYVRKEIGMATDRGKRMLVLYLEETDLTSGLYLLLGDIQAIHKEHFSNENDLVHEICKAAANSTLYQNFNIFDDYSGNLSGTAKSELLTNYKLLSQIGAGGISQVFLAEHKRTGALVAVKCGFIDDSYRGFVTRNSFNREREILTKIMRDMCPFTPIILDWFEDDTQVFIVETLIDGEPLKLKTFYSEEEVVAMGKKVLHILRYLHDNNIIHADVKPGNLIRDRYGEVYLIDFNTAMVIEKGGVKTKTLGGTLGFNPSEQFKKNISINFSSDIYSVGRTMMYLLCPEHFDRNFGISIRYYRKDVSVELESILTKMTAPLQSDRYQSVEEVLHELEKYKSTDLLKKILLLLKSQKNIRDFKNKKRKSIETRKNILYELAVDSQSYSGKNLYETVLVSDFDEKVSAEKTEFWMDE